jgi:hypothetical protein
MSNIKAGGHLIWVTAIWENRKPFVVCSKVPVKQLGLVNRTLSFLHITFLYPCKIALMIVHNLYVLNVMLDKQDLNV